MKTLLLLPAMLFLVCCATTQTSENESQIGSKKYEQVVNYVDTLILRPQTFYSELISNGKLYAKNKGDLSFSSSGVVVVLRYDNGEFVEKGAVVAELDNAQMLLRLEQAQLSVNKAKLDLQDALLGYGYSLLDSLSVPKQVMQVARIRSGYDMAINTEKMTRLELNGRVIRAPFSGKVANLKTKLYEVPAGGSFCSIINDAIFEVEFSILEGELTKVKVGQEVEISTFSDLSQRVKGIVTSINPTTDQKGQIKLRASVAKQSADMIDGMNVKVFVRSSLPNRLVVPKQAVVIRDNKEVLFTYTDDGCAHWTYIVIEATNSQSYSVRANVAKGAELGPGAAVIVTGNLNLADMSQVQIHE